MYCYQHGGMSAAINTNSRYERSVFSQGGCILLFVCFCCFVFIYLLCFSLLLLFGSKLTRRAYDIHLSHEARIQQDPSRESHVWRVKWPWTKGNPRFVRPGAPYYADCCVMNRAYPRLTSFGVRNECLYGHFSYCQFEKHKIPELLFIFASTRPLKIQIPLGLGTCFPD